MHSLFSNEHSFVFQTEFFLVFLVFYFSHHFIILNVCSVFNFNAFNSNHELEMPANKHTNRQIEENVKELKK